MKISPISSGFLLDTTMKNITCLSRIPIFYPIYSNLQEIPSNLPTPKLIQELRGEAFRVLHEVHEKSEVF